MERRYSTRDSDDRGGRDRGRDRDRDDSRGSRDRDSGRDRERGRDDVGRDDRGGERSTRGRDSSRQERGGGYNYVRRTYEQTEKRANTSTKDFDSFLRDDIKTFKPNDGENTIRILPPGWDNPEHYGIEVHVHYGIGPDEQAYLCAEKHGKGPCCICDARVKAQRDGEDEEYVNSLKPTKRGLFYLVDRAHEKDGVVAWASPWSVDTGITKVSVDKKSREVLAIDDPEEGYDVEFDKRGKGIGTKYEGIAISRRPSPLGKDEWLDFALDNPLPDILVFHDQAHIEKVFGGGSARRGDGDRDRGDSRNRDSDRGSRDRDDRDSGRGRGDAGDDGGRGRGDRDRDRGRDDRDSGRDRGDRGSSGRSSSRRSEPEVPTWSDLERMEGEELDKVVKDHDLDINPNDANSDEELREDIAKALKIDRESADGRMASMRRR